MRTFDTIGLVYDPLDVSFEAVLTVVFALAVYNFPAHSDFDTSTGGVSSYKHDDEKKRNALSIFKYSCLATICLSGLMAPSFPCVVYYILSITIMTLMILTELSDETFAYVFKATCVCTCIHTIELFTSRIELIRNKINLNLEKWAWHCRVSYLPNKNVLKFQVTSIDYLSWYDISPDRAYSSRRTFFFDNHTNRPISYAMDLFMWGMS